MSRRGFTLLELTITFCLLGILTLVAFSLFGDRVDDVAESSGRSRLQVAVTAQDSHYATYGSYATSTNFPVLDGVEVVEGPVTSGELSIVVSADGQQSGIATVEGSLCVAAGIEAGNGEVVYSTYQAEEVLCTGELGLGSL